MTRPASFRNNQMHKNHSYQSHRETECTQTEMPQTHPHLPRLKPSGQRFTFNISTKVVAHFIQNEIYIFLCWYGMGSNIGRAICGPCNSHLLPRQEENHSAIAGGWVKQTHMIRAEIKYGHGSKQVRHHQRFCSCTPCTPYKVFECYLRS